jgi:DNA-binding transcriptional MerR regulator
LQKARRYFNKLQEEYMDIEKMSSIDINKDDIKSISDKCHQLNELQTQLKEKEEALSLLKHKIRDMEERIIPEMMQEAGVSLLKLSDGSTVEVKPFYAAKIPESRVDEAFGWLRSKGFEDLIKNTVTAQFARGQDNQVAELIKVCEDHNFTYNKKQKVEPMTLKAFVREQVEGGKELPFDLFGVYIANKTTIKK